MYYKRINWRLSEIIVVICDKMLVLLNQQATLLTAMMFEFSASEPAQDHIYPLLIPLLADKMRVFCL